MPFYLSAQSISEGTTLNFLFLKNGRLITVNDDLPKNQPQIVNNRYVAINDQLFEFYQVSEFKNKIGNYINWNDEKFLLRLENGKIKVFLDSISDESKRYYVLSSNYEYVRLKFKNIKPLIENDETMFTELKASRRKIRLIKTSLYVYTVLTTSSAFLFKHDDAKAGMLIVGLFPLRILGFVNYNTLYLPIIKKYNNKQLF